MHKLYNEQREVIADAVRYPFIDRRTDKNLLVRLHREVFSSEICLTCEHEQIRAYIELYRLINPKDTTMNPPSKKYKFNPSRKNERISLKGYRGVITAENLTDDMAEMLMEKGVFGDLIVTIEEAELIIEKSKVDYSKKTVKQLKQILDDAGVDYSDAKSKDDFVKLAESI
jgi:hypothetical protein